MSDPVTGADSPDHVPGSPAAGGTGGALAAGKRWRNYSIKAELPAPAEGCFLATDASVMADVVLHARPLGADADNRRGAWSILQELPAQAFTQALDAVEENGFRYETFAAAPGQSLREWLRAHRSNLEMVETVVRQVAQGIETMHQAGLVHLNLRPETIFIGEEGQHLEIVIGGLQKTLLKGGSGLVAIAVNPYYAPPEAGGLFQHEAGEGLRAWDWWALGRLVQEMVLGCHVYGLVMERDVRGNPPELRARAEALLLERDPTGIRAGAVELLPDDTGTRLRQILRGLLASVREGRWRWSEIEAWLRGEPAPDRYDLPRNTRLIRRGEKALTLAEIADLYAQPAYFAEGVAQLFPEDEAVESVWRILQETPQFRTEFERVRVLREMTGMPPWQGQPPAMCRMAVAGLIWLALVPPSQRRPLCFGEYSLNVPGLRRMFREKPAEAEAALAVLTAEPYLQRVTSLDAAAAKALELLAKAGREAVAAARGWKVPLRPEGQAALLGWILASESELGAKCDALRARYMVCRETTLEEWLRGGTPTRVGMALLAAASEEAEAQGFVTREEWNRRRHAEILARSALLAETLFWRRLERLVAATPAFLGFWPVSLAIWVLPLAIALLAQEWVLAGLTAFVAVAGRWAGTQAVRAAVARCAPGRGAWQWHDRAIRCRREARAILPQETERATSELEAELAGLDEAFHRLTLPVGSAQPAIAPHFQAMWFSSAVAMAAPLVLLAGVVAPRYSLSPSDPSAAALAATSQAEAKPVLVHETGPDGSTLLYEVVQDGFGGHRRGPLKPWNLAKPAAPSALKIVGEAPASSNQRAFAIVSAELLLTPYPRQERTELLAVPVFRPQDSRPWIVLYDTATHRLADGRSYGIGSELVPSTWYNLTGREVIYLGETAAVKEDDLIPLR